MDSIPSPTPLISRKLKPKVMRDSNPYFGIDPDADFDVRASAAKT